jgi:dsRNA-specific ribonuclease
MIRNPKAIPPRVIVDHTDNSFRDFLANLLSAVYLRPDKVDELLDGQIALPPAHPQLAADVLNSRGIVYFSSAFTHSSADPDNNYEFYETIGDATLKKAIKWYISYRFPQINCPDGSDILTRMAIKLEQKKSFADIADRLGFLRFISRNMPDNMWNVKAIDSLLEDVFEAFFGVTELLLDQKYGIGVGYAVCYHIIANQLDKIDLPIDYEYLVDAKTRMKEMEDYYNKNHDMYFLKRYVSPDENTGYNVYRYELKTRIPQGRQYKETLQVIGVPQTDELEAAESSYQWLKVNGLVKEIPKEYIKFASV